jgi:O-acetyl-ADP-ribose deacetylase (regulator of RNase III)
MEVLRIPQFYATSQKAGLFTMVNWISNENVDSTSHTIPLATGRIELLVGDITKIPADAIVNAANSALGGGGGVDGAIHRAGGPGLMQELDRIREAEGGCPTGSAVVTGAGRLPAQYVFHAVGPVYRDGAHGEPELLRSCYVTCLNLAAERNLASISFPSISTGIYGYPVREAAAIALGTVRKWLTQPGGSIHTVKLVQFSESDHAVYRWVAANG